MTVRPLGRLLTAHQTIAPDALVDAVGYAVDEIGGRDVVLFLIDYAQVELTPHPDRRSHGEAPEIVSLDGSLAGRAFTSQRSIAVERADGWHVLVPVSDGAERLGVLAVTLPDWDETIERTCLELGQAVAPLLISSAQYSDLPHLLRRRKHLSLAAEMQWSLLPPLSFAVAGAAVSGLLEPAYEVGGDCFDYAYNRGRLDFAIFDTVGHGLGSAVLAALVVGAYRHARRAGEDLIGLAGAIDVAARTHPGLAFATAVLAHLDVPSGRLSWMTSGHPHPLIARAGSILAPVAAAPGLPLGMGAQGPVIGDIVEVDLEPGDGILLYTDGVVEARTADGDYFGEERLCDLLAREHMVGASAQEVTRRLVRTAIEHGGTAGLRDDASLLYVEWTRPDP